MKLDDLPPKYREQAQRQIDQETAHRSPEPVGGLADTKPEHREIQTLARGTSKQTGRTGRLPQFVVTLTSFRSRKLDSDNLIAGAKPLRDCIAETLGIDDGSDRITWEYNQVITKGHTGTLITVHGEP